MLIFEAQNEIKERLKLKPDFCKDIPEYFEALEMADKALEAQGRLSDLLNDFMQDSEEHQKNDTYSWALVVEFLNSLRWDYTG